MSCPVLQDTDFDKAPSPMSPGAEDEQVESKKIGGGINRGGEHRSTQRRDGEEASGGDDDDNEPTLKRAESDDSMGWSSDEEDRARKDKFAKIKIKAKAEVNEEETAEDLKNSFKSFSLGAASIGGGPMQGSRWGTCSRCCPCCACVVHVGRGQSGRAACHPALLREATRGILLATSSSAHYVHV